MAYQVGEWARVRSREWFIKTYPNPREAPYAIDGPGYYRFSRSMWALCGKNYQVRRMTTGGGGTDFDTYMLTEPSGFHWEDWMLEPVFDKKNLREVR
jgi:hypothetical protein